MKPLDALKVAFLLGGLGIWFLGWRSGNNAVMLVAIACVMIAFLLRFVKPRAPSA